MTNAAYNPTYGVTFGTTAEGTIILNDEMQQALTDAEHDFAEGRCTTMPELQKELAQWS